MQFLFLNKEHMVEYWIDVIKGQGRNNVIMKASLLGIYIN